MHFIGCLSQSQINCFKFYFQFKKNLSLNKNLVMNKPIEKKSRIKKILKFIGFSLLGLFTLFVILSVGVGIYFSNNKEKIVAEINQKINENIKGTVTIGDINYSLLKGFPNFALTVNNVVLKDSLWNIHKQTLLTSKEIEVHINLKKLIFSDEIDIKKIKINDAIINLFINKNGVSNSDIFKPKPKDTVAKTKKTTIIEAIDLENVEFISRNLSRDKLFDFEVTKLESKIKYTNSGWETDIFVNTLAKSMAFKLSKGSFIKDKRVKGTLALNYSKSENKITIVTKKLGIGDDDFDITAHFNLDKNNPVFDLDINTEILWVNATHLLDAHILKILSHFDIKKPIKANCKIVGNTSSEGDPVIVVKAIIKDNELVVPDGTFTDCSFQGEYNNTYKKGQGTSDENSAVILTNFSAKYKTIPFSIPNGMVYNLSVPILTGDFHSKFEVEKLNQFVNKNIMNFSEGNANVNLKFNVNIVEFKINKPLFSGDISVSNATLNYVPKDLVVNTDLLLKFTENALTIDNIKYKNGDNIILMKGQIDNFLTLYYDNPGKMIVNWDIYSPNFDAQKFLTILTNSKKLASAKKTPTPKKSKHLISTKLHSILDESVVNIAINADKMTYKNLTATSFSTAVQLNNGQLFINNGIIKTCNGKVTFNAKLIPIKNSYNFSADANINTVAIPQFLKAFNNFGITSFKPDNIKGNLNAITSINGSIAQNGDLIPNSLLGKVNYNITNGALDNFAPIMKVGKVAFPNRDVKNIDFYDLKGNFKLKGEHVDVDLFKVNSNVLNFDVGGIYSFGKGTNLQMTIPLRNPKDDYLIRDSIQRANLRYKGVVLNLQAIDDADGKIEIKLAPQNIEISNPFKKSKSKKNKKNEN